MVTIIRLSLWVADDYRKVVVSELFRESLENLALGRKNNALTIAQTLEHLRIGNEGRGRPDHHEYRRHRTSLSASGSRVGARVSVGDDQAGSKRDEMFRRLAVGRTESAYRLPPTNY
jgi:hypothetical protein